MRGDLAGMLGGLRAFAIPMPVRFRGITGREGALIEGPAGWGEFSPFAEYGPRESARWLASAIESATLGWPAPVRDRIPVNVTVPAVGPARAAAIVARSGCRTAKVEVAELRRHIDIPVAADESIRRAEDPLRVRAAGAADIAMLKVQPLGGVRAALEVAEACGLPVVVSSAVDTSVGLAAGVALAAALPDLPFACGLGTMSLLAGDVTAAPLRPEAGSLPVRRPAVDPGELARWETDPVPWRERASAAARYLP